MKHHGHLSDVGAHGAVTAQRPMPECLESLGERGLVNSYHPGERRRCPSCGGEQWLLGRVVASCARCEMSMPIFSTQDEIQLDHQPIRSAA
jgi:hypothetical protein